jgi:glutamyl-tRNA synthetase
MDKLVVAIKANQALTVPAVVLATALNKSEPNERISIQLDNVDLLKGANTAIELISGDSTSSGGEAAINKLRASYPSLRSKLVSYQKLVGYLSPSGKANPNLEQEDEWVQKVSNFESQNFKSIEPHLVELDSHLTLRSHIVGYFLSVADLVIWGVLRGNRAAANAVKNETYVNVTRWFKYIEEICPWTAEVMEKLNAQAKEKKVAGSKKGASYNIALKNTDKGVVTRFPPEPS